MILRFFPTKDATITNDARAGVRMTGSNCGAGQTLEVFKRSGISGAIGTLGSSSLARSFLQFDIASIAALTASGEMPSTGVSYRLRLRHKTSNDPLPYSFDAVLHPVSRSWDEGRGVDEVDLTDAGVVNWVKATTAAYWTTPGGDLLLTQTASVHFDTGYEDLDVDVTTMVDAWLSGTVSNNGLAVRLSASHESDTVYTDFFTKKFYSRTSNYPDRRPYLEASWNDRVADDRADMYWSRTGSIAIYNVVGGQFQNITGSPIIVRIRDLSGTLATLTASFTGRTGVYTASFALVSSSYSGSTFYDMWAVAGATLMTGTFTFKTDGGLQSGAPPSLTAKVKNLGNEYSFDDVERFDVFFSKKQRTLAVVATASIGPAPYIARKAYYGIKNDATSELVVPFGTGTVETTRMSYDTSGNYFKFYMSNLHRGNVYRIVLLVDELGYKQVIDPGFRFKIS